jgi:hypothetical protein
MLQVLLIFLLIAAAVFGTEAEPLSGALQQALPQLGQQGSCKELPQFGVGIHPRRNPDDINVGLVSDVGARMVRFDISWMEVERQNHYNFGSYDHLISKLRESGRSIVLLLDYGHPDHSDGTGENGLPLPPRTPEQRAAYSKFVQAVAARYNGPDIAYEIWNEPNIAWFWAPEPDSTAYGKLLSEAVSAIREVEPAATIISGGLANMNDPPEFLHELAQAGTLDRLDGIALHPYRQDEPENSLYDITKFKNAVAEPLPIWITEWGYSESWLAKLDTSHVQQRLAVMTARLMLTAALAKAKAALVYELIDDGTDSKDQESNFGLYDYDLKPKLAATAFRTVAEIISACSTYEFRLDKTIDVVTATFHFDDFVSYIVWTYAAGRPREICFAADARRTQLQDVTGNRIAVQTCADSRVELQVSESAGPLILQTKNSLFQ